MTIFDWDWEADWTTYAPMSIQETHNTTNVECDRCGAKNFSRTKDRVPLFASRYVGSRGLSGLSILYGRCVRGERVAPAPEGPPS